MNGMNNKTTISLQILMLNDLLRTKVIDEEIYKMAITKIEAANKEKQAA